MSRGRVVLRLRQRVPEAELEAAREAARHLHLQRVVVGDAEVAVERDVAVAGIGPEEVVVQRRVVAQRRIEVLRQETRAVRHLVDVLLIEQVAAARTDVGRVEDGVPSEIALHARREAVDHGRVHLLHEALHVAREQHGRRLRQPRERAVVQRRIELQRRIARRGPVRVAGLPRVVEDADAGAQRGLAVASAGRTTRRTAARRSGPAARGSRPDSCRRCRAPCRSTDRPCPARTRRSSRPAPSDPSPDRVPGARR